jgi:hypothetical protein
MLAWRMPVQVASFDVDRLAGSAEFGSTAAGEKFVLQVNWLAWGR